MRLVTVGAGGSMGKSASFAGKKGKQGYLRTLRTNRGIEALGNKLKEFEAIQSNAQKMGKQLSATIDSWMLRIVLPGYLMYLLMEFFGVWMGKPVEPVQVGLSGPGAQHQIQFEFFDYRSQKTLKHYKGMFWTADDSTDITIAYRDLEKLKNAELMFNDIVHFTKLVHDASAWDFGATQINAGDAAKNFLADNETQGGVPMTGGVGMFNDYAGIHAYWADTTNMDNLRGADITDHAVAGSFEDVTRGGSTVHTNSSVSTGTTA